MHLILYSFVVSNLFKLTNFYYSILPTICVINSICSFIFTFFKFSTFSLPPSPSKGTYPKHSSKLSLPFLIIHMA